MKKILFGFVLMMITFSTSLHAEVPTQQNVTKLYVATFNRAPDAAGLNYWVNNAGLSLEGIAQSFFDQPETQEAYPPSSTNEDFIIAVYANLFNRTPDEAGLDYWVAELDSGRIAKSVFILAVINGAQNSILGNDANILENKTIVGLAFVEAGLDDVELAKEIMSGITDDENTVNIALETAGLVSETTINGSILVIKKTGQIKSHDYHYEVTDGSVKDDGYYQTGVTPNYTRDDSKNIVIDHITGLEWQDDPAVATVKKRWLTSDKYDYDNIRWYDTSGDTATTYCANLSLDGGGWRLPTVNELQSLLDDYNYDESIRNLNIAFENHVFNSWTSTTAVYPNGDGTVYPYRAWIVVFRTDSGGVATSTKYTEMPVRCVRRTQ